MKKSLIKKGILCFFGHIVLSVGFCIAASEEYRFEILRGFVDPYSPSYDTASTICTVVGVLLAILGFIMILGFYIEIAKRLPFLANKTVKGAKKVMTKIGNGATNSFDRMEEDEGLERLQKQHGIIKDKDSNKQKDNNNSSDTVEYYEYEKADVSEGEIKSVLNGVCKYASDSLAKVTMTHYSLHKNNDGSYDIDVYLEAKLYGIEGADEYYSHQASVEKLANELLNDVTEAVSGLGCGFSVIPHL